MRINWFRVKALAALAAALIFTPLIVQAAAPAFPAIGSHIQVFSWHISGAKTATETNSVRLNAPYNMRLLYATASARLKTGTFQSEGVTNSSQIRIMNAGVQAMTIDLVQPAAATVQEATPVSSALQNVAVNTALSVDLFLAGASPSITDTTVTLWIQRQN